MSFTDYVDAYRLSYELGPPLTVVLAIALAIYVRWRHGQRQLGSLLSHWLVFSVCVTSAIGLPLFYRYWGVPERFSDYETGILVAELPTQDEQNRCARAIREFVAGDPNLAAVVKVRLLERPLPTGAERQQVVATSIGRRLKASFVLRSVPGTGRHQCWLTLINRPGSTRPEPLAGSLAQAQIHELNNLPLPSNMTIIARCVLALSFYRHRQYEDAVNHLNKVLSAPELQSATTRPHLLYVLGNAYYRLRSAGRAADLQRAIRAWEEALSGFEAHGFTQCAQDTRRVLRLSRRELSEAIDPRLPPQPTSGPEIHP